MLQSNGGEPLWAPPLEIFSSDIATMSVWAAIALVMIASACMNLGLVLQKKGIVAPLGAQSTRGRLTIGRVRHTPIWYLGMLLMVGGYGLYAAAVSARVAPISLLQPLSASGLLVVAFLAVVYLHERFDAAEWLGVGILLAGVILLGLSARGPQIASTGIETSRYFPFLAVGATLAVAVAVATATMPARSELFLGILAGLLFGAGYLNTKALALAVQDRNTTLTIVAACLMTVGLLGGLVALQIGLRVGRALIVTAVNLVTNQVLVVAGGLVCLGETFPRETFPFTARIVGLCGILGGILLLARVGSGATQTGTAQERVWSPESKPLSY
jgi:drug/metabolite transporter (DMT)-like permease